MACLETQKGAARSATRQSKLTNQVGPHNRCKRLRDPEPHPALPRFDLWTHLSVLSNKSSILLPAPAHPAVPTS